MKLIFTGHNDRYAIEQDLLAFFPTERPVYDPDARWGKRPTDPVR